MSNRTVLITGGTRGIGFEVVRMLLQCDMKVIIGRNFKFFFLYNELIKGVHINKKRDKKSKNNFCLKKLEFKVVYICLMLLPSP